MKASIQTALKYLKQHLFTSQVIQPGVPIIDRYPFYWIFWKNLYTGVYAYLQQELHLLSKYHYGYRPKSTTTFV